MSKKKPNNSKRYAGKPKKPPVKKTGKTVEKPQIKESKPKQPSLITAAPFLKPNVPRQDTKKQSEEPPDVIESLEKPPASVIMMPTEEEIRAEEEKKKREAEEKKRQDDKKKQEDQARPAATEQPTVIPAEPLLHSISTEYAPPKKQNLPPSVLKLKRRKRIRRFMAVFGLLAIVSSAAYYHLQENRQDIATENSQLIVQVSQRALVPADETPAITTVVDEKKVNQDFLKGTQKGDKVLLYFKAGRAVVYRPSTGQVVNMGPLEAPKPQVFIRNGSDKGDISALTARLSESGEYDLGSRDDSPRKNYDKTIVVDVTGIRPEVAEKLASLLGAKVAALPEGESRPDADLLVIVGNDSKR